MKIIKIVSDNFAQNNYLVVSGEEAILIDANVKVKQLEENIKQLSSSVRVKAILLTHGHFDHIEQLDNLIARYDCDVYINKFSKKFLTSDKYNMSKDMYKPLKVADTQHYKIFKDGERLSICGLNVDCYLTPGHTEDSSCFVIEDNMFTGDTVFRNEIGRYDLPTGSESVLKITLERIRDTLSSGINYFYAGHGANFGKTELDNTINYFLGE